MINHEETEKELTSDVIHSGAKKYNQYRDRCYYRLLGEPTHVCIMRNLHNSSLAVRPCVAEDVMSFQVPDHFMEDSNVKFCVHSKQFVQQIMHDCNLDTDKTFVFYGEWLEEKNAVVFMLKDWV